MFFVLHDYADDMCLKCVKKLLPMKFMITDHFLITFFCLQIHNHRKHLRDSISTEEWEVEKPC